MYNFIFYCIVFVCLLQGIQIVGFIRWKLFLDVMNVLFMWFLENEVEYEFMEVKQKYVEEYRFRSQIFVYIIVFLQYLLFLQKQRYFICKFDYFFVFSIVVIKLEIKSYFYDSEYDILLESRGMNLFIEILEIKS